MFDDFYKLFKILKMNKLENFYELSINFNKLMFLQNIKLYINKKSRENKRFF